MKILDRYIVGKFIGTFSFMLILLSVIVLVIDVQAKSSRIEDNGFKVAYFLINFYPYWIIYLIMTFMSILVFISVIFFTSRMANNTEIVAIISGGTSFNRFARPYFVTATFIALLSLLTNHFILPWANIKKNELEVYTMSSSKREKAIGTVEVSTNLNPKEYIFISSYNRKEKRGSGFTYQKYDKNKKLIQQISASEIIWNSDIKKFKLTQFFEKNILKNDSEILRNGTEKLVDYGYPPEELFPGLLTGQTKTTPELIKFIKREKEKGNKNLNSYLDELYQRTSMPVSIIILTILALSLSSEKKRGGLGLNLALGIALAFVFIFSFEALKVVSEKGVLNPLLAMWLPNLIFGPIAAMLYFKRANQ